MMRAVAQTQMEGISQERFLSIGQTVYEHLCKEYFRERDVEVLIGDELRRGDFAAMAEIAFEAAEEFAEQFRHQEPSQGPSQEN